MYLGVVVVDTIRHGLLLAQPGYDEASDITHTITRRHSMQHPASQPPHDLVSCGFRYTNFVENGVAILSSAALQAVVGALAVSPSGAGLDYVMPALLGNPTNGIAVLDVVPCHHPGRKVLPQN
eukprot:472598-Pyramimonas_sp.AAC.2